MNLVVLVGRLTGDPRTHAFDTGKRKVEFGLATNEFRGGQTTAEYHDCVAWDKLAEIIGEHAKKGSMMEITGRLSTRKYTNRDNIEVKRTEVIVNTMNFVDAGRRAEGKPSRPQQTRFDPDPDTGW